jgi:glycosyltransferase involved in cell wall biosynthesis
VTDLAIIVPVLGRPQRVKPLLANIRETTPDARVLFLPDRDDWKERLALDKAGAWYLNCDGGYAHKIRQGIVHTSEPLVFAAADDLEFQPGWFEAAGKYLTDGVQIVGVNDLLPRARQHATHFLMTREYAELPTIDGGPGPFFDGYAHWYCDDELIGTARKRGAYAYAEDSRVKHLHPAGGRAEDDDTYRKGRERRRLDRRIYMRRRHLWA